MILHPKGSMVVSKSAMSFLYCLLFLHICLVSFMAYVLIITSTSSWLLLKTTFRDKKRKTEYLHDLSKLSMVFVEKF